jgi:secondary thiamine-phosphate synthase enzyme
MQYALYGYGYVIVVAEYGQDISVMMDWYISMKSKTEYLTFNTTTRCAFVNITPDVRKIIEASGIKEGLCLVNAMHITASVFINDNESGLHDDFEKWLESLAPHAPTERYRHNETGEDNADAHSNVKLWGVRQSLL